MSGVGASRLQRKTRETSPIHDTAAWKASPFESSTFFSKRVEKSIMRQVCVVEIFTEIRFHLFFTWFCMRSLAAFVCLWCGLRFFDLVLPAPGGKPISPTNVLMPHLSPRSFPPSSVQRGRSLAHLLCSEVCSFDPKWGGDISLFITGLQGDDAMPWYSVLCIFVIYRVSSFL